MSQQPRERWHWAGWVAAALAACVMVALNLAEQDNGFSLQTRSMHPVVFMKSQGVPISFRYSSAPGMQSRLDVVALVLDVAFSVCIIIVFGSLVNRITRSNVWRRQFSIGSIFRLTAAVSVLLAIFRVAPDFVGGIVFLAILICIPMVLIYILGIVLKPLGRYINERNFPHSIASRDELDNQNDRTSC